MAADHQQLIPGQLSNVLRNPLLQHEEGDAAAAIYCPVPLGTPWVLVIGKDRHGRAQLQLREAQSLGETDSPVHDVTSVAIPEDLATAVGEAIGRMVAEAQEPEHQPTPKREEAEFHFISYADGRVVGTAWTLSPPADSPPARLVELAGILFTLVQGPSEDLTARVRRLAAELSVPPSR